MCDGCYSVLLELYEAERKLDERNFAKGHSFEEWARQRQQVLTPELALIGMAADEVEEIVGAFVSQEESQ